MTPLEACLIGAATMIARSLISVWFQHQRRQYYGTFLAERIDFMHELKPRVNIRAKVPS